MSDHDQAPDNPVDGDRFVCEHCGVSAVFVVLDDGLPGEWVDVTPADPKPGDSECTHVRVSGIYAPPGGAWSCDSCGEQFHPASLSCVIPTDPKPGGLSLDALPLHERDTMIVEVWTFLIGRGYTITAPGLEPDPKPGDPS